MPIDYTNNYVGFIRINNFNKNRFKRFCKIKTRVEIMSGLKAKEFEIHKRTPPAEDSVGVETFE